MDIFICKPEIKTGFPDSPISGHEEKHLQKSGPDIKPLIKIESYEHHDLLKNESGTSKCVKQTRNVNEIVKSQSNSSNYQYGNYTSELQAVLNEVSNENVVNKTEIKEEKLFHFQDSLDIKNEEKPELEIGKPVNFDLSTEEMQRLDAEKVEFNQNIFFDY